MPISGRPYAHSARRRGRQAFAAYFQWVDDALRRRAVGYRLFESPLIILPDVHRLARLRFRGSVFADVHASRVLLQQASERASASLTPRQVLALQLNCER